MDYDCDALDSPNQEFIDDLISKKAKLISDVANNISVAKRAQKEGYDKRHSSHKPLSVGTKVYIKNSRRIHRMGSKLEPQWIGPYEVIENLDKGRARLKNLKTGQKLKNVYHGSSLKVNIDITA